MHEGNLLRAGTLIQCVRRWGTMDASKRESAVIRCKTVEGAREYDSFEIELLIKQPGAKNA
jgi:hypothetical protein